MENKEIAELFEGDGLRKYFDEILSRYFREKRWSDIISTIEEWVKKLRKEIIALYLYRSAIYELNNDFDNALKDLEEVCRLDNAYLYYYWQRKGELEKKKKEV